MRSSGGDGVMGRRPGRRLGIWGVVLLVLGVVLFTGAGVFVKSRIMARSIPSDSMRPTYKPGDMAYFVLGNGDGIRRGDIVLVEGSAWDIDGDVLKRVVALGGDRISYRKGDSRLTLNGESLVEPHLLDRSQPAAIPFDVTVPEGRMFLMGDNRGNSNDSSFRLQDPDGMPPVSAVRGKAVDEWPLADQVVVAVGGWLAGPLAVAGAGLGIAALLVKRRARKAAAAVPPGRLAA